MIRARGASRSASSRRCSTGPSSSATPFSEALDVVMRGPSDWSAGERELFAGFTSLLNQCPF